MIGKTDDTFASQLLIDVRRYGAEHRSHSHEFHQLVLPLKGQLQLEVEGKGQCVSTEAHIAVIASGDKHGFAATSDNEFIVADVPLQWMTMLERLPTFIKVTPSLLHYIRFVAVQINTGKVSVYMQQQILTLLIELLSAEFNQSAVVDKRLLLAKNYLDENLSESISLAQVAGIACLSIRQLTTLFKQQWGLTIAQYLLQQRMKKALYLLNLGKLSVEQVAHLVGYQSLSSFSYRFKQYFGYSPTQLPD